MSKNFDTLPLSWRDRWLDFRNRALANARFQAAVARFPLTRCLAARRAADLFNIINGFVYSQIVVACVQLDLFELLRRGPRSASDLAAAMSVSLDAATRLLKAAATLALVEPAGRERYALGELGAALLGNPAVLPMIEHHALFYADLADPVALLRGDAVRPALATYWPYAGSSAPAAIPANVSQGYSALMAATQPLLAAQVLAAYPLKRHRRLLDVGGGEGAFLIAAAVHAPHLELQLFDLPGVVARAPSRFAAAGLANRVEISSGDMFADQWSRGADIISLVRVLHDHGDEAVLAILRRAFDALPAGGTLLIAEPMASTPGAAAMGDGYFGFYLLAMGSGRPRTAKEYCSMLRAVGFAKARRATTSTPLTATLIVAHR